MTLETNFYHFGLSAGLPFSVLHSVANATSETVHARDCLTRRRMARELTEGSDLNRFVPREKGFAELTPTTLPGTEEALAVARRLVAERRDNPTRVKSSNPFVYLERPDDFVNYPEFLNFALSDELLQMACGYYGTLPQLKHVSIWLSNPVNEIFGSQYYHLDKPESCILSVFLNIEENKPESGRTTFLPADVSKAVRRATRYDRMYFTGTSRISDEDIYRHCERSDAIELDGREGYGAIVDTTNCFHYGSRCSSGHRVVLSVKFMLAHRARETRTPDLDGHPYGDDPIRSLVLAGARPA